MGNRLRLELLRFGTSSSKFRGLIVSGKTSAPLLLHQSFRLFSLSHKFYFHFNKCEATLSSVSRVYIHTRIHIRSVLCDT